MPTRTGGCGRCLIALLKLGNAFQAVSGRSGNAVYRTTRLGTEFAVRPFVNNPDTPAQNAVRSSFTRVTKQWRTLTPAQAAAWNAYAASRAESQRITGSRVPRTGFNWFVGLGARYLNVNPNATTAPTMPPTSEFYGDGISITAREEDGGIVFTASAANGANVTTALLVQRLRNVNAKPGKAYRTPAHKKFTSGSLETTVPVGPGYYAVGYQFVDVNTGQETEMVLLGVVGPISFAVREGQPKRKAA